jgi:predicted nucleic acid-binding protein
MMPDHLPVFVDTGPWIALVDPRDQWHSEAERVLRQLQMSRQPLVTSNLVLMESYTGLVNRVERRVIARFRETIYNSRQIDVQRVDMLTEELAWELFLRYDDKGVSMVDCSSFAIMEQSGIAQAFTFDRHFVQAGFQTLPKLR